MLINAFHHLLSLRTLKLRERNERNLIRILENSPRIIANEVAVHYLESIDITCNGSRFLSMRTRFAETVSIVILDSKTSYIR